MENILLLLVVTLYLGQHSCYKRPDVCEGCLLLSPIIREGESGPRKARLLSTVDPKSFRGIKSHSGFINVNEKYNSNLFFWFILAEDALETTPWIIWLQGGPGFSSMYGLFDLIGPFMIEDGEVKLREFAWTNDYSVLFLDNPVGAGFSFTGSKEGYPDNEDDIGYQMFTFLQQFLLMFPELIKAPLFIAGQSYAGKYVPALAVQIHRRKSEIPINLRGISMGNALIDPRNMMQYSKICSVLGILDEDEINTLKLLERTTVNLTDEGKMIDAANKFNETIEYIKKHSGVSVYNFLNDNPTEHEAPAFEAYLNRKEIRNLIHTGNAKFNFNNQLVYKKMLPDFMNSTKTFVEVLLEDYGVMSYSGQLDIILGYSLAANMFKCMQWSLRSEYDKAPRRKIYEEETTKIVAYIKDGGNFYDVLIRGAGHNVPLDQPEVAKFIIDNFIHNFK